MWMCLGYNPCTYFGLDAATALNHMKRREKIKIHLFYNRIHNLFKYLSIPEGLKRNERELVSYYSPDDVGVTVSYGT